MEKAILKTINYADIFDSPLTIWEIHKWLIGTKATLRQVEKALNKLVKQSRIRNKRDYFFLASRNRIVSMRLENKKKSKGYFIQAQIIASFFKLIPWVKLVGVSGGLAMENPGKDGDIDLFVIASKNRLWLSRLLMLIFLSLTTLRRSVSDDHKSAEGKFCLNMILEEDRLEQQRKDLFTAHEVLQMKLLWQRDNMYSKFLESNSWAFKFLPNWIGSRNVQHKMRNVKKCSEKVNFIENLAKKFQLWYMSKPKGDERILDGAVYFHPHDYGLEVLSRFKSQLVKVNP